MTKTQAQEMLEQYSQLLGTEDQPQYYTVNGHDYKVTSVGYRKSNPEDETSYSPVLYLQPKNFGRTEETISITLDELFELYPHLRELP